MIVKYNLIEPQRIDKYLSYLEVPGLYSRSLIEKLISEGHIKVNGCIVKKNYALKHDDTIDINVPEPPPQKAAPEDIPLDIVYEDKYLAVINKQPNLIVHPTPTNYSGTLVNAILHHFGDNLAKRDDDIRPGIVHRLDKNTSGLLIIAKDDKTLYLLNKIFASRKIAKFYKAITAGIPKELQGTVHTHIDRSCKDRTKMIVSKKGKEAVTQYKVEKVFNYFSLVDVKPQTGRTHQIRVHLNYINCPVLGDQAYGGNKLKNLIPLNLYKKVIFYLERHLKRFALHAYRLEFEHPITGKHLSPEVPLAEDIKDCLAWMRTFLDETEIDS